jgi:hypothetical protein
VRAVASRPRYRTIGRSVSAIVRRGIRGLLFQASRSASLVGGPAKNAVVSNGIHSASAAASTDSSGPGSSKNPRWRTSTAYRWDRGSRRRKPANVGVSAGVNDPGSWIQTAWVRAPSGSIASRKIRSSSSAPVSRRSCVMRLGSLITNRKPGPVCSAHEATVSRAGVA